LFDFADEGVVFFEPPGTTRSIERSSTWRGIYFLF